MNLNNCFVINDKIGIPTYLFRDVILYRYYILPLK